MKTSKGLRFLVTRQTLLLISYKKIELKVNLCLITIFITTFIIITTFTKKVMRSLGRLVWTPEDNISNICTIELCQ